MTYAVVALAGLLAGFVAAMGMGILIGWLHNRAEKERTTRMLQVATKIAEDVERRFSGESVTVDEAIALDAVRRMSAGLRVVPDEEPKH